jgi:restriction system protein
MAEKTMTLREAAIELLRAGGPKHYEKLTEEILAKGLASSSSKTPAASLNAMIAVDIKRNGTKSEFVRLRPGVFGLRALHAATATPDLAPEELSPGADGTASVEAKQDETEHRVRTTALPHVSGGSPPAQGLAGAAAEAGHWAPGDHRRASRYPAEHR